MNVKKQIRTQNIYKFYQKNWAIYNKLSDL